MVIFCFRYPLEIYAASTFRKLLPTAKYPLSTKLREQKLEDLQERPYKVITHIFFTAWIYSILKESTFLHVQMGGNIEHPLFFENYPCNKLPKILDDLYIIKLTYHFYELPYALMF